MAQFAVNIMCPSERGPPAVMGLFASSATKRSAAQNLDYVPGNIIHHHHSRRTAKPAKRLLVKLSPHPRTRAEGQQPNTLATRAQRQHEKPRAPVLRPPARTVKFELETRAIAHESSLAQQRH